jgi:hypothetical protein
MKNKYFKTTAGEPIQVFVLAKALGSYADGAATLEAVATATAGTVAVILDADNSVTSSALEVGAKFRIAQTNSAKVKLSNVLSFVAGSVRKVAYTAPVKQVSSLEDNSITVTAGKNYGISFIDTTFPQEPMIRLTYEVTAAVGDGIYGVFSKLVKRINDVASPENDTNGRLVTGHITQSGGTATQVVTSAPANVTATVVAGSTAVTMSGTPTSATLTVGDIIQIDGTTGGNYKVVATSTTSLTLDRPYTGTSGASKSMFKITVAPVYKMTFTAVNYGDHFKLVAQENLEDATLATGTKFKIGSGTPEHVTELEKEGFVYEGYSTDNVAFKEDYGVPTSFVDAAGTYVLYFIDYFNTDKAIAGNAALVQDKHYGHIVIAVHDGDASEATLDTVFGV